MFVVARVLLVLRWGDMYPKTRPAIKVLWDLLEDVEQRRRDVPERRKLDLDPPDDILLNNIHEFLQPLERFLFKDDFPILTIFLEERFRLADLVFLAGEPVRR